jgi:CheY-like chemotaxis protein
MSNDPPQTRSGMPHVLVVEDHALVRQFLTMVIGNAGFRVTTADNGDSALTLLEQGLEADMLLSDIRMPGSIDGLQLARWARQRRPQMAILLQTGFSEGPVEEFRVLQKPYPPEVLLASIQAELKRVRGD